MAGFLLDNRSGAYRLAGRVYPGDLVKGTARAAAAGGKVSLVYQGTFLAKPRARDGLCRQPGVPRDGAGRARSGRQPGKR
jgi:hypothetical protein